MNKVLDDVRKKNKGCETRSIVADFSKMIRINEYQEQIADKVKDLDVGMLIVNAGIIFTDDFCAHSNQMAEDMHNVNATHALYMTKVMVNQLTERFDKTKQKSGLVVMSSAAALGFPYPAFSIYAAAKSYAKFIGEGLNYELKEKVDVIASVPMGVQTYLMWANETRPGFITAEECVRCIFRDLGYVGVTVGSVSHVFITEYI
jgi:17beta-estradiol 17-dehydrogenase / very-long-chain 3-oxoacyl-CoA reductase